MIQAILLALVAGYADTVGYLRFKAFAGLMTGNTIFMGVELSERKWSAAGYHGTIIVMFLAGVVCAQALIRFRMPVWAVLCISASLLVVCGLVDHLSASLALAAAMGLQNSAANRFNGVALNTVFVTGNLQKVGEGLSAWLWPSGDKKSTGFAIYGWVWTAYAAGAALGAVADQNLSQPLLLPACILPLVMVPWPDVRKPDA